MERIHANSKLPEHFSPLGFTRDGSGLYGTFEQNKKKQLAIVLLAAPDAKPRMLTSIPSGVGTATISPDGKRFAVVADPRPVDDLAEVHTVVENEAVEPFRGECRRNGRCVVVPFAHTTRGNGVGARRIFGRHRFADTHDWLSLRSQLD